MMAKLAETVMETGFAEKRETLRDYTDLMHRC